MNIVSSAPSAKPTSKVQQFGKSLQTSRDPTQGEHSTRHTLLSLYSELPSGPISLEEFESLALDRLRVLKGLEDYKLRNKSEAEIQEKSRELISKYLEGANNEETARRDQISHYILRLAYCRSADLRKWFINQESELFRLRFADLLKSADDKAQFLSRSKLSYTPVGSAERDELRDQLKSVMASQNIANDVQETELAAGFYKVPFTAVPDLVSGRKCLLKGGWAYVSNRDLASLVVQDFRLAISKGLADINRRYRDMFPESDTRLRPLVAGLSTRYLGSADAAAAAATRHGPVSLATLPAIAAQHFPLCMQHLVTKLHTDSHLKHGGRQQLGLFLKAIGLPMEDALVFWRNAFAPKMPADKFEKEHAYNIRHNYGKEGARKDYSAHNCLSLVRATGGRDDYHGCPYKRMDDGTMRGALIRAGCEGSKVEEAVSKARAGHYQIACACAFEGIHKTDMDVGINHPTDYYNESRRIAEERAAEAVAAKASTAPAAGSAATAGQGSSAQGAAGPDSRASTAASAPQPAV